MTYADLCKANSTLNTTDIKGKAYVEVNNRVKAFRQLFPNGQITTQIVSIENGVCVMQATIADENGMILATGTAYEKEGSTFINKTSYIENCETSAVGRALAFVGIGIDTSIASVEEVQNAMNNQKKKTISPEQKMQLLGEINRTGVDPKAILDRYKVSSIDDLTTEQFESAMRCLKKTK